MISQNVSPIRRRTTEERVAYIQGFEAGATAALDAVRRLNFSDVAERAEEHISVTLGEITGFSRPPSRGRSVS